MDKIVLRYCKTLDHKNRVLIPADMIRQLKCKEFYVELLEDKTIRLIPKEKEKKGE